MRRIFIMWFMLFSASTTTLADYLITAPDSLRHNQADYLIVTHDTFTSALFPLCRLRDSLGLDVKMAELSLIYSAFPNGPRTDRIRAFLQTVFDSWTRRPTYLLLVGDACKDSNLGDFLPVKRFPKFSYPYYGGLTEHGIDNWFATLSGNDSVPDIIIGRLPVNMPARCESLVAKIIRYEPRADTGLWVRTAMLLASDDRTQYADYIDTVFLRPNGDSIYKVYESQGNSSYLRTKTRAGFNQGASLLCQSTHGSQPPAWVGSRTLFSYEDVDSLVNVDRLPVVLGRG